MQKRYYLGLGGKRAARFLTSTVISGDSSQVTEQANLYGMPGATLGIEVVTYTNNNRLGRLKANGSDVFLHNTLGVTLDGSGRGSFTAQVMGDASDHGTVVLGKFEIISTTIGDISSTRNVYQISKVF